MAGYQSVADRTLHSWQKAVLSVYDEEFSAWRPIRTVTDVKLVVEVEEGPPIPEFRGGQEINLDQHNISRRMRVGFKPQLINDPSVNNVFMPSDPAQSLDLGGAEAWTHLYNFANCPVFLPAGTAVLLPNSCGPGAAVAAALIGIGTLATPVGSANWRYYIYCLYDDVVSDNSLGASVVDNAQLAFTNPPSDAIALNWANNPAIGVPDGYRIYRSGDAGVTWDNIGDTNVTNFIDDGTIAQGGNLEALPAGATMVVSNTAGVPYVAGVDYTYNAARHQLDRVDGGGILSFGVVLVEFARTFTSRVRHHLGLGSWEPSYTAIRIEQIREVSGEPTGVAIELDRVKTNGAGVTLTMLEKDLSVYDAVEWEAYYSDTTGLFGHIYNYAEAIGVIT